MSGLGLVDTQVGNRIRQKEQPALSSVDYRMWAVSDGCYMACQHAVDALPASAFCIDISPSSGIVFRKTECKTDNLIHFPDCVSDMVIAEIAKFWTKEEHFRSRGFMWKRGFMIYGPPGSGKTSTVNIVCAHHIMTGGVAVYLSSPSVDSAGLKILRKIEPTRPLLIIIEDIDAVASSHGDSDLLSLLDGETQIDNVVYIATTNYPERLDPRLVNRPSRFDIVAKIGMPSAEARGVYLRSRSKQLSDKEIDEWVQATEEFSFAHLKELIDSVEVFERPFAECVERLKMMMQCKSSSSEFKSPAKMGFGS